MTLVDDINSVLIAVVLIVTVYCLVQLGIILTRARRCSRRMACLMEAKWVVDRLKALWPKSSKK